MIKRSFLSLSPTKYFQPPKQGRLRKHIVDSLMAITNQVERPALYFNQDSKIMTMTLLGSCLRGMYCMGGSMSLELGRE
jgi:hypothetical protein